MNFFLLKILFLVFCSPIFSLEISLNKGWNIVVGLSSLSELSNNNQIAIIWGYQNKKWLYYSLDSKIRTALTKFDSLKELHSWEAYYIKCSSNTFVSVNSTTASDSLRLPYSAWTFLRGTDKNIEDILQENKDIKKVYEYSSGKWCSRQNPDILQQDINDKVKYISSNSGYWIYSGVLNVTDTFENAIFGNSKIH